MDQRAERREGGMGGREGRGPTSDGFSQTEPVGINETKGY